MHKQVFVTQPQDGIRYSSLFESACAMGGFDDMAAAVAYATTKGVESLLGLLGTCQEAVITDARKRWLVGIDWCRSEPAALDLLCGLPRSEVRIPFGRVTVERRGCVPRVTYHPKSYLLNGPTIRAVIMGSGNLSASGLERGHEWGSLSLVADPRRKADKPLEEGLDAVQAWFDRLWRKATRYGAIRDDYIREWNSVDHLRNPAPTDEDVADTKRTERNGRGRTIKPDLLRKMRVTDHLWIQAGRLHKNRGPLKPGNQLMLSPMTRVFFGFPAKDVATDTHIGNVKIRYGRTVRENCSLRYSNNSMDVLGLPIPGEEGPPEYDNKVLLFTREPDGLFVLKVGSPADVRSWPKRSDRIDGSAEMTSGRQWGVF